MSARINYLLVEDNDLEAETVERFFRKTDTAESVIRAADGIEALEILRGQSNKSVEKPTVVLLDLNMPRMDGLQFLALLREDKGLKSTPVIILTTSDDHNDIDIAHQLNVQGYIVKPTGKWEISKAFSVITSYLSINRHP